MMFFTLVLLTYFVSSANALRLVEYRILVPVSQSEYQRAQRYQVIQESKANTGGGEGVEIVTNEPFEKESHPKKGQYTHKIYHLMSKVPKFLRVLAPRGSLEVHEACWNAYPEIKTELSNVYMKYGFHVTINTICKAGESDPKNVFQLEEKRLKQREIQRIDIIQYKDPSWNEKTILYPTVTCYKLVEIEFRWHMLQKTMEDRLVRFYRKIFTDFNRKLVSTVNEWYGLTMDDVKALEEKAKIELDNMRMKGPVRGMKEMRR